jgi:hypothetical protein
VVRLPAGAVIRVTPLVARSARVVTERELDELEDVGALPGWGERDEPLPVIGDATPEHEGTAEGRSIDQLDEAEPADEPAGAGRAGTDRSGAGARWLAGERLGPGMHVLRDRVAPGGRTHIDRVIVASSGVWVVAIETGSRVEMHTGDRRRIVERRLLVGGHDRTDLATEIGVAAHQVRKLAARYDVPVHAAVCVVGAERSLLSTMHRLHGVWVSGPRQLVELIEKPGPFDVEEARIVAELLGTRLRLAR